MINMNIETQTHVMQNCESNVHYYVRKQPEHFTIYAQMATATQDALVEVVDIVSDAAVDATPKRDD